MLHPAWIEREAPLARCPRKDCRRSHSCRRPEGYKLPCQRLHETKEFFRWNLARKLERIKKDLLSGNPDGPSQPVDHDSMEFQLKLKSMKEMLHARDKEDWERRKAEAQKARPARRRAPSSGYPG